MFTSPQEVLDFIKNEDVVFVDIRFTDMPGVQFYSGNFLNRYNAAEHRYYKKRMALCLETQCAPDSVHHAGENGFDVMTIEPGRPLDSTTVYQFETL